MQYAAPPAKRSMKEHWPAFRLVAVLCWEKRPLWRFDGCFLGIVGIIGPGSGLPAVGGPTSEGAKKKKTKQ